MLRFLKGVRFAWIGIKRLLKTERNFQIQVFCGAMVIVMAYCFGLSRYDWVLVLALIGIVLAAEAFNSAIERLCDLYSQAHDERIAWIKDVAAGAVMLLAAISAVIGVLIFYPYLKSFWY